LLQKLVLAVRDGLYPAEAAQAGGIEQEELDEALRRADAASDASIDF